MFSCLRREPDVVKLFPIFHFALGNMLLQRNDLRNDVSTNNDNELFLESWMNHILFSVAENKENRSFHPFFCRERSRNFCFRQGQSTLPTAKKKFRFCCGRSSISAKSSHRQSEFSERFVIAIEPLSLLLIKGIQICDFLRFLPMNYIGSSEPFHEFSTRTSTSTLKLAV